MAISVPALMAFSLGRSIVVTAGATLFLICSCDKHHLGEYPEVQREKGAEPNPANGQAEASTPAPVSSPSPAAKPTPVDFFPTKPR
jgi:hypothetical protein